MLEAAGSAAQQLFAPGPMLALLIMVPIAMVAGLLPGGGLPFVVVVLSFADRLDPFISIPVVVGYLAANDLMEPVPSILMGIPGSRASQATILDGYPMARRGEAGMALGASYTASLIGGLVGAAALFSVLPIARELLRLFGSAEFFLLTLLGIAAVGIVSSGAVAKGLLTAAFGLLLAMIGFAPIDGVIRADFGVDYLWDGIPLIPVVIGLFAVPEAVDLVVGNTPIARQRLEEMLAEANRDVYRGMREALRHKWLVVRCSLIGVFVGAMPGLGPTPAHWIAYAHARQTEKGALQSFGKGDIRGVIAPESSNNATDGGALIPTLIFGIPGNAPMAILLGFLIIVGIQPGPAMLDEHLDMTLALVMIIAIANIIVVPIALFFSRWLTKLAAVPPNVLVPIVIGLTTISAFQATKQMGDLVLLAAFIVLGLFMKAYGWPRPPILIAIVLANPLERFMHIAIQAYGWQMLARPQFIAIILVIVVGVYFSLRVRAKAGGSEEAAVEMLPEVVPEEGDSSANE